MACLQADLEDQILKMLSSATGSLLDNIELINALDASKATFETVTQSLMVGLWLFRHPKAKLINKFIVSNVSARQCAFSLLVAGACIHTTT